MIQTVTAIPAFADNYIWAIGTTTNKHLVLVDPGDASVCIDYINKHNLCLTAILITHHHPDHTGGISNLLNFQQKSVPKAKKIVVYGPANETIPHCDQPLNENDIITINEIDLSLKVIALSGHTLGHIAYVNSNNDSDNDNNLLFCGDTLFSGGCGRLFEGSAQQMHTSLKKLSLLANNTPVYCAHEYTLANLKFALTVEPNNQALQQYYQQVTQLRQNNLPTIPSSIEREKQINPFLRVNSEEIKTMVQRYTKKTFTNEVDVFSTIRKWKDSF